MASNEMTQAMMVVIATDESVLKMLVLVLQVEYECPIVPCNSGREVVEWLRQHKPDLVIVHWELIGSDALELADEVHSIEGLQNIPILLTHVPFVRESERRGPSLLLLGTPFAVGELYAAITTCLGNNT